MQQINNQFFPGDDAFSIDQTVQSNKLRHVYYRRRHIGFTFVRQFIFIVCLCVSVLECVYMYQPIRGKQPNRWDPLLSQIPLVLHPVAPAQVAVCVFLSRSLCSPHCV